MSLTYDELESMHISQVRAYAAKLNLGFSRTEKKKELVERIVSVQALAQMEKSPEQKHEKHEPNDNRLRTKPPALHPTTKEIHEACQVFIDQRGLVLEFPTEDTFYIKCGKKEDSGNIRQPLRVIVNRADSISR